MFRKLIIDYEYVKKTFANYVTDYDPQNPKVALKIAHTYRVAELCKLIAESIELSREYNLYRQNYCGCEFSKRD